MSESSASATVDQSDSRLPLSAVLRCLLALLCSHVAAPYAAARLTIRYQLQGDFELRHVLISAAALTVGALLAFRQLTPLPLSRRIRLLLLLLALWTAVSFLLLAIAAVSEIPFVVLGLMWAGGSFWAAWTVWAWGLFRARGVLIGSVFVCLGAAPFWVLIEAVGLTGSIKPEFAWRQNVDRSWMAEDARETTVAATILWPGFLGSSRDGVLTTTTLDTNWEAHPPETLWTTGCGTGWSSFAATETTLFSQEQIADADCITARDIRSGQLLWKTEEPHNGYTSGLGGNGPRATPQLIAEDTVSHLPLRLLTAGPSGILSCLNAVDGEVVWQVDLMQQFPGENLEHGVCGSPVLVDDLVVVSPPNGPCLAAFHQNSGELAWSCDSDWRASYASPALMTICGQRQIVQHAGPGPLAVDPRNGKTLWQFEWSNEHDSNCTQPLQVQGQPDDLLVATGYQGGIARIAVRETAEGQLRASEVWSNRRTMKTRFCNLAQFGGVVVGLDNSILCGVDVETGKRVWKKGRYEHGQFLRVQNLLLLIEEKGRIRILKPDLQGHHPQGDGFDAFRRKTWSHPVLITDQLFLRNDREMTCVRLPVLTPPTDAVPGQG